MVRLITNRHDGLVSSDLHLIDPDGNLAAQAEVMDHACSTSGFFRIPAACVDQTSADEAWDTATEFFALPADRKAAVAFPRPGYPYGYSPFQFETLSASVGATSAPDLKESFSAGPDCSGSVDVDPNSAEAWIRSPSLWPSDLPTMQAAWSAHYRSMSTASARLLNIMASALELPDGYFEPMIDHHTSAMRAINYPAVELASTTSSLRAGSHTDYGTLTILRTDGVPGLEIQNLDGSWLALDAVPDTYVVNLGDSIARWTNERWRSTMHRVTNADPRARQSMAFFHTANWDATIECLPSCLSDDGPLYEPTLAGPWLMSKFQSTVAEPSS